MSGHRYDPSFQVEEAEAYRREVPDAEVYILDAGHFALEEQPDAIADLTRRFLQPRQAHTDKQTGVKPTIVLVHGAFADASSWNGVIERLQQQGYTVSWSVRRKAAWCSRLAVCRGQARKRARR